MAFDKIDTIQDTGKSVTSGLCMICVCCIASIVCTSMGIHYLNVGETEYIANEKDINDIEDRMVEYPVPATTSDFVEQDVEIVYYGEIRNVPGTLLVDNTFSTVSAESVRFARTAEIWGVIESVSCNTQSTTVNCQNSDNKASSKSVDTLTTCTYTYSEGWTTSASTCANDFVDDSCIPQSYPSSSSSKCSSISSNPNTCYITGGGQQTYSTKCNEWNAYAGFSSPCTGTSCGGTSTIGTYKFGDFYVTDHYLLDKYFGKSPVSTSQASIISNSTTDGLFATCDSSNTCNNGMCSHMYSSRMPDGTAGNTICDRVGTAVFEYGDQRVYFQNFYAMENLYTCTKQDWRTGDSTSEWWLVQASTESSGGGLDNLMEIDYDLLDRTKLTKDICIQTYRDENDENLSTMRWICGFLLVFSCIFVFCSFACCFDIMTDMLTLVPQLLAEAVCCGLDYLSDGIQAIEDCADTMVYCLCMCIGSCVGLAWFGFIFAIIWVSANAGFGGLFAICFIFLCCFVALGFSFMRVTQKKKEEREGQKPGDVESGTTEMPSKNLYEQPPQNQAPQTYGQQPPQSYGQQPAQSYGQQPPQQAPQEYQPQPQQQQQNQGGMMGMMTGMMNQAQNQMNQMQQGQNQGQYQQSQQSWGNAPGYAPNNGDLNNDGIPDHLQNNLPPGFECRKDPGSGRFYWVNHANQQSQWHDPRGAAPAY